MAAIRDAGVIEDIDTDLLLAVETSVLGRFTHATLLLVGDGLAELIDEPLPVLGRQRRDGNRRATFAWSRLDVLEIVFRNEVR